MATAVPDDRVRTLNDRPVAGSGRYVLYWMIAARRLTWNFALQRAVEHALALRKPLLVFEAVGTRYEHASARFHRFLLDGMHANAQAAQKARVRYLPYVEPTARAGRGLLAALAAEACVVVTDDHPGPPYPRLVERAMPGVPVRFEAVDGNGLLPVAAADRAWPTAFAFRRHLQRTLPDHVGTKPAADPLRLLKDLPAARVPRSITTRWPAARATLLAPGAPVPEDLPLDHDVAPVETRGGPEVGRSALRRFLRERLGGYAEHRNQVEPEQVSALSPYLHFGHVGAHQVFAAVARKEGWSTERLGTVAAGKRRGWWGMDENAEAFVDQLVTWRELGHVWCALRPDDVRDYDALPDWALRTLAKHATDLRPHVYDLAELEGAATHDEIWNAAQRQLVREGRMHNYLRMLWGKKILEWSATPAEALEVMIHLNDKYALDGRDPNSYSGITWTMGRYDRAWGPERPIFGTVRYMSSENTRRKIKLGAYLERYGPERQGDLW